VEGLRELIRRVLEDPRLVEEHRRRALERAASLPDWDEVAARTEKLYLQLARRTRAANRG
jgi:glycosyltransferase involved in cell wall biosynthesis